MSMHAQLHTHLCAAQHARGCKQASAPPHATRRAASCHLRCRYCQQLNPVLDLLAQELADQKHAAFYVAKVMLQPCLGRGCMPRALCSPDHEVSGRTRCGGTAHTQVDGTQSKVLMQRFDTDAFPTIYVLRGSRTWQYDANGGRTVPAVSFWVWSLHGAQAGAQQVGAQAGTRWAELCAVPVAAQLKEFVLRGYAKTPQQSWHKTPRSYFGIWLGKLFRCGLLFSLKQHACGLPVHSRSALHGPITHYAAARNRTALPGCLAWMQRPWRAGIRLHAPQGGAQVVGPDHSAGSPGDTRGGRRCSHLHAGQPAPAQRKIQRRRWVRARAC